MLNNLVRDYKITIELILKKFKNAITPRIIKNTSTAEMSVLACVTGLLKFMNALYTSYTNKYIYY